MDAVELEAQIKTYMKEQRVSDLNQMCAGVVAEKMIQKGLNSFEKILKQENLRKLRSATQIPLEIINRGTNNAFAYLSAFGYDTFKAALFELVDVYET